LVDDLLTAARLEANALEMRVEPVRVRDVLDQTIAVVSRAHPAAEIITDVPGALSVSADQDRLAQALENLLGNAVRHGASPVHVLARATDVGEVEIRVRDAGPGVAEAVRPRLFSRFATGPTTGGTGLGLFIVRELVRSQGGDATYDPGGPGSPAGEFVIHLPGASVLPDDGAGGR
jgi:signal transduction histidine kinase